MSKKKIPLGLKCTIWTEVVGINDITTCPLCNNIISVPEDVRNKLKIKPINCSKYTNAHFGHIISEHNGGQTIKNNLKIICLRCNVKMGIQNMNDFYLEMDISDSPIEYMTIDSETDRCIGITREGTQCKNKPLMYCNTCGIHKEQKFVK